MSIRIVVPWLCVLYMLTIFWWTVPRNFETLQYDEHYDSTPLFAGETSLLNALTPAEKSPLRLILNYVIDLTGSQQYWEFFAPASPKFHQYLSVCAEVIRHPERGQIICSSKPLFSNFTFAFKGFNFLQVDDSRLYRLTENLTGLNNPLLLKAFKHYYQTRNTPPFMLLHQFELYPGLHGMPDYGYQMDSLVADP